MNYNIIETKKEINNKYFNKNNKDKNNNITYIAKSL